MSEAFLDTKTNKISSLMRVRFPLANPKNGQNWSDMVKNLVNDPNVNNMVIRVVEFSSEGYKIGKTFA